MAVYITVESTNAQDVASTSQSTLPSLAAILACREASSGMMEHEKMILVMKEHDYAKTPDMTQLAPFLRLLTEDGLPSEEERVGRPSKILNKKAFVKRSELLDVRMALAEVRTRLLREDGALSTHLNKMVSLQATLIHQLQDQVFFKDLEMSTIKREKEQLEARLERMERRMSILQKRTKQKEDQEPDSSSSSTATTAINSTPQPKPEQITRLARSESTTSRNSRSRSSSAEAIGRRNSRTSGTPNSLEVSHKAVKRGVENSFHSSASKRTRSLPSVLDENLTTSECYDGLGLSLPPNMVVQLDSSSEVLLVVDNKQDNEQFVRVPSWRVHEVYSPTMTRNASVQEDMSDESFTKRHSKPENEEKRRKRWDAQRMRERLNHDKLLKRYMMKEGCLPQQDRRKDKVSSFQPKLDDLEEIQITENLVVSAFGRPLPNIKPSAFRLPNFDPHAMKSTRGKKSRPTSNSGSV